MDYYLTQSISKFLRSSSVIAELVVEGPIPAAFDALTVQLIGVPGLKPLRIRETDPLLFTIKGKSGDVTRRYSSLIISSHERV